MMDITDVDSRRPVSEGNCKGGKVYVANGDQGTVVAVSKRRAELIVKFDDPKRFVKWRISGKK